MFGLGVPELVVLGVIVLVLFGSRLPSAMRALGGSFHSFKKGMEEGEAEDRNLESKDS